MIAHALNALDVADAREVEDHISTCPDCRTEVDSWKETASSLAFSAEPAIPSSEVRARVLKQARVLSNRATERPAHAADNVAGNVAPTKSNVVPILSPQRRKWSTGQMFGAVAASLVITLLLGTLVVVWKRNKAMEAEVARLSRQVSEAQKELASSREETALLTAPDARVASLTGTEMAKEARAMIAYDRASGRAMLVANGLPPAPNGQAYQLWFIPKGKQPMPGGVFATDAAGHAEMHDVVPPEGRNDAVFAVTLERAGGVPSPQGKTYMKGNAS